MVCRRGRGCCPGRHSSRPTIYCLSRGRRQSPTADGLPRGRWPRVNMSCQFGSTPQIQGAPYLQARPTKTFLQDTAVWPLCGQFEPFTSAQTNPTPDLTPTPTLPLTLTLTSTSTLSLTNGRQGQGQSCGSAACFGGAFLKKPGRPKTQPRAARPASCRKFFAARACK